ncbi:uncharacterized protein LOC122461467 [Chelonia mydas]|uniref:uncharacterized protein LOC122461467 n=1 Tax=Chelonia mydas TaxID=8469 RepID=UPI001CA83C78|nr:uncharacterized protein LOC122461467 [Chelonia mydas]
MGTLAVALESWTWEHAAGGWSMWDPEAAGVPAPAPIPWIWCPSPSTWSHVGGWWHCSPVPGQWKRAGYSVLSPGGVTPHPSCCNWLWSRGSIGPALRVSAGQGGELSLLVSSILCCDQKQIRGLWGPRQSKWGSHPTPSTYSSPCPPPAPHPSAPAHNPQGAGPQIPLGRLWLHVPAPPSGKCWQSQGRHTCLGSAPSSLIPPGLGHCPDNPWPGQEPEPCPGPGGARCLKGQHRHFPRAVASWSQLGGMLWVPAGASSASASAAAIPSPAPTAGGGSWFPGFVPSGSLASLPAWLAWGRPEPMSPSGTVAFRSVGHSQ